MAGSQSSKRVLDLCDEALGLPAAERDAFLASVCAGDERLRASVDSVLLAVDQAGTFLLGGDDTRLDPVDLTGRRIDTYLVKESLGEGGMGSVYLAERHEPGYAQRVAIKFVHGHLLARELIERFNAERQLLAAMNHPYIAALIDSGTTDEGIPYIVMEYVDGLPIDRYCDDNKLSIRDRIRLIQKVAMAVQAAHQNLIVHRDLKPSNVLVTADGIPKLLDFGVAKLIRPDEADTHGNTTIFGHQAMTPDYASPEQILENKVTTASDVYSLGVLAYQILVGERPYRIETGNHREFLKSVESLTVPKPSTRLNTIGSAELRRQIAVQRATTVERLQRALQGDIDNILLMALRQEPERRYATVAQFADDLGRYVDGLPVAAHADTFGYRAKKFLQRNWLPTSAAALIMLSLAGGVIAYATQAEEAKRQRDMAQAHALTAERTVGYLKDVLFAGDPFRSSENEQTVADVLTYAEKNLQQQYAAEPALKATLLSALGDIHAARANYERSQALSAEAIALYENELGTASNAAANAYRIHGLSLYYQDDYQQADAFFQTAIDIYQQTEDTDWGGLARAYDQMAMVQGNIADEQSALEYYNLALATYREHQLDDPDQLISILTNIGVANMQQGKYAEADPYFLEAIKLGRESGTSDAYMAVMLSNRAGVQKNLGHTDAATANYEEAVQMLERSLGPTHPETITSQTSLANHYRQVGDLGSAAATIRKAVAAAETSLPEVDFIASYVQNIGGAILCLGEDVPFGTQLAEKSLAARRALLPEGHWAITSGEGIVGMCYAAAGDFDKAETILRGAYEALRESRGEAHEVTLATRERLHELYLAWQKPQLAEKYALAP